MHGHRIILAATIVMQLATGAAAQTGFYWIGNSLTNNALVQSNVPGGLANQWHIDAGQTLNYIYDNPSNPSAGTSTPWNTAFAAKQFSVISVQPFPGAVDDFESVVTVIEAWVDLQPSALVLIHNGWAPHATIDTEYENASTANVQRSPAFMNALLARLQSDYPTRRFAMTYTHSIVYDIKQDCDAELAPFATVDYLYVDDLHLTGGSGNDGAGSYLANSAMRRALNLPYAEDTTCSASSAIKAYIRQKIDVYHGQQKTSGAFP